MKIGVDIRVLTDNYYSGVSIFTLELLKNLEKIDKSNTYYFFYNSFKSQKILFPTKNIVHTAYPNKIFNYLMQRNLNYPKIDKLIGDIDIFYSPHINFCSLSARVKKVITVHDVSFLRYPEFFSGRKNFWHKSLNIKKKLSNFDKIIVVSENTKNDLLELLDVDESRVELIYPGVSKAIEPGVDFDFSYLKSKYGINKPYLLYLGTIEPRKNIISLIRAYNLFREKGHNFCLVLVGAWGWKTANIKTEWEKSKYFNDIKFVSYVNEVDKAVFYKFAELFLYPSFYEGFGFPPLEAMSYSVPVVAGNSSSLPEVLSDSALLINPDKVFDLFNAMETIILDNNIKNTLISRGLRRVELFKWEETAKKYLNSFYNLFS